MRAHLRVFGISALCCVPVVCVLWLFVVFTDDELVLRALLATFVVLVFVALFVAAGVWLWEEYGPAARRRRRGRERSVGPAGRARLPMGTSGPLAGRRSRSLGPAFTLHTSRRRNR